MIRFYNGSIQKKFTVRIKNIKMLVHNLDAYQLMIKNKGYQINFKLYNIVQCIILKYTFMDQKFRLLAK